MAENVNWLALRIDFNPTLASEIEDLLLSKQLTYDDSHKTYSLLGANYQEAGYRYSVSLTAQIEGVTWPYIALWFRHESARVTHDAPANLMRIVSVLDELAMSGVVTCSFQTSVMSTDEFEPILEMPLLVFNGGSSYFQEVRGYRLVRVVDERDMESVTLDAPADDQLVASGWTTFASPSISSEVVFTAFGRVVNVQNQAILKVRSGGG